MALQIGQLRKNNIQNYLTNVTGYSFSEQTVNNVNLLPDTSYYINFNLKSDVNSTISVYLQKEENNDSQLVKTFEVIANVQNVLSTVITPNSNYTKIVIQGTNGADLTIAINQLQIVKNVLNDLSISSLAKVGIQGPSGLTMCINGEEIKVGRFGIYEMIKNIKVEYIGFIIQQNDDTFFIMDYQY